MDLETIRKRLSKYRIENDLGFKEMSLSIGMSVGNLWKFLNDKVNPNERTLYKIKKYLKKNGVSV